MRKHLISFFIIFLVIFWIFRDFPKTFFQQDEWAIFGNMIYTKLMYKDILGLILPQSGLSHVVPFTRIFTRVVFDLFGLNFYPQAIVSVVVHALNSFLVYILAYLLLRKWSVSLLSAFFFATNANTHQATTWLATNIGTQGCASFLLLSLIWFVVYLRKNEIIYMWLSAFSWLLSLGFKENSFFLLLLLPLYYVIAKKNNYSNLLRDFLPFGIIFVFYFATRLFIAFSAPPPPGATAAYTQPGLTTLIYRMIFLPFKSYVQVLMPITSLLQMSSWLIYYAYPQFLDNAKNPNPYLVESVSVDIVMFLLTVLFIITVYISIVDQKIKNKSVFDAFLFCILYIPLSVVLLTLVGGKAGYASLIEPRNLYYPAIGMSILLSLFLERIFTKLKTTVGFLVSFIIISLFIVYLVFVNVGSIQQDVKILVSRSSMRRNILTEIYSRYSTLPTKVIFFIPSDTAYYGLATTTLPFQSGLGQTLLVWYHLSGQRFPVCFFDYHKDFLYEIESQEYKECEGRGFGYFRSYSQLLSVLRDNKLSPEAVISFRWVDKNKQLIDETAEVRKNLLKDL